MKNFAMALALGILVTGPAFAQDQGAPQQGGHGAFMAACGADIKNFCASAQSRDDRRACVTANKDKFSDSCKSFMTSHPMHRHGQMQGGSGQ